MNDEHIKHLFQTARTIASVGVSSDVTKDSFGVVTYLHARGYRIIPVNPKAERIIGAKVFHDLLEIPDQQRVDVVQVFRPADEAPGIVEKAIRIGASCVWLQEGIVSEDAAAIARAAGLTIVMDRCMMQEHRRLIELPPLG